MGVSITAGVQGYLQDQTVTRVPLVKPIIGLLVID
jgi:hypothetical protein